MSDRSLHVQSAGAAAAPSNLTRGSASGGAAARRQKLFLDLHGSPTVQHALGMHDKPEAAAAAAAVKLFLPSCKDVCLCYLCPAQPQASPTSAAPSASDALAELYLRLEDAGISRNLLDAVNVEGLTPVTLAVSLGKRELFEALWGERAKQIWTYGASKGVCAYLYPLDGIDDSGDVCDENEPLPAPGPARTLPAGVVSSPVHSQQSSALFLPTWRSQGFISKAFTEHKRVGYGEGEGKSAPLKGEPSAAQPAPPASAPPAAAFYQLRPAPPADLQASAACGAAGLWRFLLLLPKLLLTRLKWQLKWWLPLPFCACACSRRGPTCLQRQRARQLTCEDVLVRYEKWEMLEPMATDERVQKQFSAGAASLAALGLSSEWQAQSGDIDEGVMERKFASYLQESNHWLHVTTAQQAGAALDGARYVHRDSTSVLEQLSECKWARLYAPRFARLFFFRLASVVLAWVYLAFRTRLADGAVPSPQQPMHASPYGVFVLAFVALTGLLFFTHLSRFMVLGLPLLLKRCFCTRDLKEEGCLRAWRSRTCHWGGSAAAPAAVRDRNRAALPRNAWCETPETTLYASAHSGRFGVFHLLTLLLGSGLLFTGGYLDYMYGLAAAGIVSDGGAPAVFYATGSFFLSLHLLYFALGWEYTGPLLVMVFSVVSTEFVRWVWLVLPILLCFAFPFYFLAAFPSPGAAAAAAAAAPLAANATAANATAAAGAPAWLSLSSGQLFAGSLGAVIDQQFNPWASSDYLGYASAGGATGIAASNYLALAGWLGMVLVLSITLMSLLIAMFSRAFDAQSERGADFLIERLRAEMLLESLQTYHERFHARQRDKSFLLNLTLDVHPSGHRLEPRTAPGQESSANAHRSALLHRPYFLHKQPMPLDAATASSNRVLAKKALAKQALSTTSTLAQALQHARQGGAEGSTSGGGGGGEAGR